MPQPVSLLVVLESTGAEDGPVCDLLKHAAESLATARLEGTFLLDAARIGHFRSKHADVVELLERQNVAYLAQSGGRSAMSYCSGSSWDEGSRTFLRNETEGYNAACWMSTALPAAAAMRGWAPQPFAAMAEWGVRAILGTTSPLGGYDRPYFYCGRLHLSNLGPNDIALPADQWLDTASVLSLVETIANRASRLASPGGVIVLRLPLDAAARTPDDAQRAAAHFGSILDRVRNVPHLAIQSARQVVDRFADISYEHAVPVDVIRSVSCWSWSGELRPFHYEQGYLSPAEQLYGLARIWSESIQKGKPVRNTTIKSPLGPAERATTDPSVKGIAAEEVAGLLEKLVSTVDNVGQLPASMETKAGRIAIHDLLPTLADGINPTFEPADMELRKGSVDESRVQASRIRECLVDAGLPVDTDTTSLTELAKLQLLTYKPVLGLTG